MAGAYWAVITLKITRKLALVQRRLADQSTQVPLTICLATLLIAGIEMSLLQIASHKCIFPNLWHLTTPFGLHCIFRHIYFPESNRVSRSSSNVVLIFESVDKILKCEHSNESECLHLNGHTLKMLSTDSKHRTTLDDERDSKLRLWKVKAPEWQLSLFQKGVPPGLDHLLTGWFLCRIVCNNFGRPPPTKSRLSRLVTNLVPRTVISRFACGKSNRCCCGPSPPPLFHNSPYVHRPTTARFCTCV